MDYDHLYYTAGEETIKEKHERYIVVEQAHKESYLSKNRLVKWFFIILGYPVYFIYGLIIKHAFLDGWHGITSNHFLAKYFARARYLEVFIKKRFGLIKYSPFLECPK